MKRRAVERTAFIVGTIVAFALGLSGLRGLLITIIEFCCIALASGAIYFSVRRISKMP
jgi:hypothetical protein